MLGKKELQQRLAQREDTLSQREAEIAVLSKRVEQLTGQESKMQAELEGYRSRREAIVSALMEAQQAAARIREEAETYKSQVMGSAYSERDAVRKEAKDILQMAKQRAEQILAAAEQQAAARQAQADVTVAKAGEKAVHIKENLRRMAEEARRQAEAFGAFMTELDNTDTGADEEAARNLPADYSSPAALMQNIYTLQGRDLPPGAEGDAEKPEQAPAPASTEEVDALLSELVDSLDDEEDAAMAADAQVLYVEDILAAGPAGAEAAEPVATPGDLDAIIDDILKGI